MESSRLLRVSPLYLRRKSIKAARSLGFSSSRFLSDPPLPQFNLRVHVDQYGTMSLDKVQQRHGGPVGHSISTAVICISQRKQKRKSLKKPELPEKEPPAFSCEWLTGRLGFNCLPGTEMLSMCVAVRHCLVAPAICSGCWVSPTTWLSQLFLTSPGTEWWLDACFLWISVSSKTAEVMAGERDSLMRIVLSGVRQGHEAVLRPSLPLGLLHFLPCDGFSSIWEAGFHITCRSGNVKFMQLGRIGAGNLCWEYHTWPIVSS